MLFFAIIHIKTSFLIIIVLHEITNNLTKSTKIISVCKSESAATLDFILGLLPSHLLLRI